MTTKENAPAMTEAQSTTAQPNSNTSPERETIRPLFHALTWRGADQAQQIPEAKTTDPLVGWHQLADQARKAQTPFRGKAKRNARRDAIANKRMQGGNAIIDAMLLAAGVSWLFAVCMWLASEVLR